jgi:hypothetical protein
MKRLAQQLTILFLLFFLNTNAQNDVTTYLGFPVYVKIDTIKKNLLSKGCKLVEESSFHFSINNNNEDREEEVTFYSENNNEYVYRLIIVTRNIKNIDPVDYYLEFVDYIVNEIKIKPLVYNAKLDNGDVYSTWSIDNINYLVCIKSNMDIVYIEEIDKTQSTFNILLK